MISEQLKSITKNLHDRVEAKFNSDKIFSGTFTTEDYRMLIHYNYLFLLNFENNVFSKISPANSGKLNLENRRKLHLIEKDLEILNIPRATQQDISVKNEAEAFGILYVMEGSTLGGNVIAKQLSKNPAFQEVSFNYFRCYGENTGMMWKNFKEVLNLEIVEQDYEDCIAGAQKAYAFLLAASL